MDFLCDMDLEAPSRSDPDLFSHDAKRHCAAMVPAEKEIFQKNFGLGSLREQRPASWQKARLAGSVNQL
jgi:hypothetical protein